MDISSTNQKELPNGKPFATLGGGCFWCVEAEFRRLEGVLFVQSGYEGGTLENPTYRDICTGQTGHAEVTRVYYDPAIISYHDLLIHFFTIAHDPTEINRQGVNVGTQYRSAIFYQNDNEKEQIQNAIDDVKKSGRWKKPIVTTLEPHKTFWPAEDYHQRYYERYEDETGHPHINMVLKHRKWQSLKA